MSGSPDQHPTNIHFVVQCYLVVYARLGRLKTERSIYAFF